MSITTCELMNKFRGLVACGSEPQQSLLEQILGMLQIRRTGESLTSGHCFFGTALIRIRTSGGVEAGELMPLATRLSISLV